MLSDWIAGGDSAYDMIFEIINSQLSDVMRLSIFPPL